jgi:hypothetical protein
VAGETPACWATSEIVVARERFTTAFPSLAALLRVQRVTIAQRSLKPLSGVFRPVVRLEMHQLTTLWESDFLIR